VGSVVTFASTVAGTTTSYTWNCTNGVTTSSQCGASYTPPVVVVPGVCSTTVTGVQSSPLTTGGCAVGSVVSFVKNGTNPEVYTWKCQSPNGGADSNQCSASYVPRVVVVPKPGICSSTLTGPQTAPISNGACDVGSVINFTAIGTNPISYSWKCRSPNGGTDSNTCTASYTTTTPPGSPSLTIKKYVKDIATGDTQAAPLTVAPGETFNYYYTLENTSTTAAKNVVVKDTFPMDLVFAGNITVQNAAGTDVTADWNCVK
jgi:uncharacterized repeat protein (TIGR01451 family)